MSEELRQFLIGRMPRLSLAFDSIGERALPQGWPEPDPYAPHGDAEFNEAEHDRDDDGKFTEGGGAKKEVSTPRGPVKLGTRQVPVKGGSVEISVRPHREFHGTFTVTAYDQQKQYLGSLHLGPNRRDDAKWSAGNLFVNPDSHRRGIATALYDAAYQAGMRPIVPDFDKLSPAGRDFWDASRKKRGFKGYEWKLKSRTKSTQDAEFSEQDVKRDDGGKFTSGGAETHLKSDGGEGSGKIQGKNDKQYDVTHSLGVNNEHTYTVSQNGKYVGEARLSHTGKHVVDLGVTPEHRSNGIASALYDHIEDHLGYKLQPSPVYQTAAGQAFWASRAKKSAQDIAMDAALKRFAAGRLNHLVIALDARPAWRIPPWPVLALDFEKGGGDFKESDVKRDNGKFAEQAGGGAAEPAEEPKAEEPPKAAPAKKASRATPEERAAAKAAETERKAVAAAERKAASERKKAAARGHPQAFISPNGMNLTMAGAEHELAGKRQEVWQTLSSAIDTRLGFSRTNSEGAIGVWSDGAENTLIVDYSKKADYQLVKAATAMKAAIGNQKAALIFQPDPDGKGHMASFEAKGTINEISDKLVNEGLSFHTLEPITGGGARVHLFIENQKTGAAFERVAQAIGTNVESTPGNGEFIGNKLEDGTDDAQRADAQRDYRSIIETVAASPLGKNKDIRGIWDDTNNHWRSATGADNGVGLKGSQGHPALISSRRPTAAGALESDRYRRADLDALKEDPAIFKATMEIFKNSKAYPNFRPGTFDGKSPDEIASIVTDHIVDNLIFLYHNADDEVKKHGPQWYEGAHGLAQAKSTQYDLPIQSTSAVYASLSPQKDWDQNVYLGDHLIDIHQTKQDYAWDDDMTKKAKEIFSKEEDDDETATEQKKKNKKKIQDAVLRITGKKLSQLTNPVDKAIWIRTYDEAHSDRYFDNMSPDGRRVGPAKNDDGTRATAAWQSTPMITHAVQALESGGDRNVISTAMGNKNKVRCFYCNILDPTSGNDDVTMDTHAVGAAFLSPMTGKSQAVMHNLTTTPQGKKDIAKAKAEGWKAPPTANALGLGGSYGLIADAYRKAAKQLKIPQSRILQSVTWEAKRRLMPDNMTAVRKADLENVWQDYHNGKIERQAAQSKVLEIARRKDEPVKKAPAKKRSADGAKRASPPAVDARPRYPSDAGQLHLRQLGLRSPGAMDSRTRDGAAGRAAGPQQGRGRGVGCGWSIPPFPAPKPWCGWSIPRFAFDAEGPAHAPAGSAKGGQFVSKGGGGGGHAPVRASSASWTGRTNTPGGGGLGPTATKAAERAKQAVKSISKEDYEILKKTLPSQQKGWGQKLAGMAHALPQLMKAHGREELHKAKHAAGALGAIMHGRRPTPEQTKGLRQFGVSLALSGGMMLAGDPTGMLAHGASYVAQHLAQEFAQHAVMEHIGKLGLAASRYAHYAVTGGGDAALTEGITPEEMKLLQGFVATLARTVATYKIPDDRLAQLMGQTKAA